jgi:hypothetical protein
MIFLPKSHRQELVFSLFSVWIEPLLCRYLYLYWYLLLLGVLLSIPLSGVLQFNPTITNMTSPIT